MAPSATTAPEPPMMVMTTNAPTEAPCGKPMMSGEPSGLRVSAWKMAPESAERDADQDRAQHARQPQVADDEARAARRHLPSSETITSPGGIGKSPVPNAKTNKATKITTRTPETTIGRRRTRSDTPSPTRMTPAPNRSGLDTVAITAAAIRLPAHERDEHRRADHGQHHARR